MTAAHTSVTADCHSGSPEPRVPAQLGAGTRGLETLGVGLDDADSLRHTFLVRVVDE
jgi:hypothetical protein